MLLTNQYSVNKLYRVTTQEKFMHVFVFKRSIFIVLFYLFFYIYVLFFIFILFYFILFIFF